MGERQQVFFGDKEWPSPWGPFLFQTACVDLALRPPVAPLLDEVAAEFIRTDAEGTPRFGERIVSAVIVLGYEHTQAPLMALHTDYNGMWERHPGLWERVLGRGFPTTFWLVDAARKPFYAIIQPALGHDFELWSASDVRDTDLCRRYLNNEDFRWHAPLVPVRPDELDGMCAYVESRRRA